MHWISFGIFVLFSGLVCANLVQQTRPTGERPGVRNTIPVSVLKNMSKIRSASEFVKQYLIRGEKSKEDVAPGSPPDEIDSEDERIDRNLTKKFEEDVFSGPGSVDETGLDLVDDYFPQISEGCKPAIKVVALARHHKPGGMYWPDCVTLEQCNGCCGSDLLECQPVNQSAHIIQAISMVYNWTQSKFLYLGIERFEVNRHLMCDCLCKTKRHHCNPDKHYYIAEKCSCQCRSDLKESPSTCTSRQKWDDYACECVCQKNITCPPQEYFHPGSCSCVSREALGDHADIGKSNVCPHLQCRARHAAELRDGICTCVESQQWGEQQEAGSVDIIETDTTTTRRPMRRPRPSRERPERRMRRPRARREAAQEASLLN